LAPLKSIWIPIKAVASPCLLVHRLESESTTIKADYFTRYRSFFFVRNCQKQSKLDFNFERSSSKFYKLGPLFSTKVAAFFKEI